MKSKKIFIIRHGQTDFNLKGIVQGCGVDSDINETGKQQAEAFYQKYKNYPFDKVYTSNLKRTAQSVQKFLDAGLPHEKLEGLNEIHWGNKEGQPFAPEENDYYLYVTKGWQEGNIDLCIEGGESPVKVQDRQKIALDYILGKENEGNILICMHGRAMRILLCLMLNYHLKCMDIFEHQNLGLYEITFTGSMFVVDNYNDTSHLEGL
ncbi:MAG: histidine phosphatase family protein [Bacteroidota bacterium]|nr:histidine phosphatase family protein [Bacteroidota bacterium]